ncbi:hypothetical protein [Nitrospira sp. BLG_1]|uniref:hypothetical protein n=1 Tax=Nitrospira sp. BLG_1 TaxID=3395883 RepID=UPI0039BCC85C
MNAFALIFLLMNLAALFLLPRRWTPLPILLGACYIPALQLIQLGPAHLSVMRALIAGGLVRIIMRNERLVGGLNSLDRLVMVWAVWMLVSSYFHKDQSAALVYRLGLVYDAGGIYFLLRILCTSLDDVVGLCRITAILLVPLAIEMLYEKVTLQNLFYEAVGDPIGLYIRNGTVRAQGPFAHAIIAGTVAATTMPIIMVLWRQSRKEAIVGLGACLVIIFTCGSSGPIMSMASGFAALFMWRHRAQIPLVFWIMVASYVVLDLVMKEPAYYIMARIDLVGGSGGWHRARLIESAIEHLDEWWVAGTDYTRHWMPSGVSWSAEHTDITNHYLKMGVIGGLPLMLLFMGILMQGFSAVRWTVQAVSQRLSKHQFTCWALGASLFAHATTFISVSYFDQSFVFIYLTLAAIGSVYSNAPMKSRVRLSTSSLGDHALLIKRT